MDDDNDNNYEQNDYNEEQDYDNQQNINFIEGNENNYDNQNLNESDQQYYQDNQGDEEDEEEDEFPDYANEQNKKLNDIIKSKKKEIKQLESAIDKYESRIQLLKEHYKSVQSEQLHTKQLIDVTNKEIEEEDHQKQLQSRTVGRYKNEIKKLDKQKIEIQERLNDVQHQIFKGNEKMDKLKLEMNYNSEQLEQWALAARQKEEDNIQLDRYKKNDEVKLKELNLQIEKLTIEVKRKQVDLETKITETQTVQIELDKTSELFKKHNEERQQTFNQVYEVQQNIINRNKSIFAEGDYLAKIKKEIKDYVHILAEKQEQLEKEKKHSNAQEQKIIILERKLAEDRQKNQKLSEQLKYLDADIQIQKNQVSAYASELNNKKNKNNVLNEELQIKKQRLNKMQKKFNINQTKINNQEIIGKTVEQQKQEANEQFALAQKQRTQIDEKIQKQKEQLFKETQQLFKLREQEANLYGEIQSIMSHRRNLQAHINKLSNEFARQQELLYNAEYQIQLMERKVQHAKGVRSTEEKKNLKEKTEADEAKLKVIAENHKTLLKSSKNLEEELRAVDRRLDLVQKNKNKYHEQIEELILENDMTGQANIKLGKKKEEELVRVDVMKLEIQKIKNVLTENIDTVFTLDNRKQQLEQSIQEREKEINVHKDVLVAEVKAAEKERHKVAVEVAKRSNKVLNLKIKYEALVQKNKASSGDIETANEHSQAYFVIKAAQEKEELQRKGDELNAKILKSEKELKALIHTNEHLQTMNFKARTQITHKGVTKQDRDTKDQLEDQCKAQSKNLFTKQKKLQQLQKEKDEDFQKLAEVQNKIEALEQQGKRLEQSHNQMNKELEDQEAKKQRAEKLKQTNHSACIKKKINLQDNKHLFMMNYDILCNLNKTLLSSIYNVAVEFPELQAAFDVHLQQNGLKLPSREPSQIDAQSYKSTSQFSQKSRQSVQSQSSKSSQMSKKGQMIKKK